MAEQKAKVVKVGRGGPRGPRPKVQNPGKIFMRILRYVMECYRIQVVAVVICIFVSVFANVQGTLFMQTLIDGYILPLLKEQSSDFSGLAHAIARTAGFYGIGIVAAFAQARMMAYVTQGTLKCLRDEMFTHMQTLPIKYFDTHAHGDIMSTYTNDTDALRQLVGQSIPTLLSSSLTLLVAVALMLWYSVIMSAVFVLCCVLMFFVVKKVGGASSKYMVAQQRSLGSEEGFVEEMMKGQKVVKVFTHEERAKADFDKYNEQLYADAKNAHIYGNVLGPILGNIGNFTYVFLAICGGYQMLGQYYKTWDGVQLDFIGAIGVQLHPDLNEKALIYCTSDACKGMGFTKEAVTLFTDWALRNADTPYLVLAVDENNASAARLAEKCGFTLSERRITVSHRLLGMTGDTYLYFRKY